MLVSLTTDFSFLGIESKIYFPRTSIKELGATSTAHLEKNPDKTEKNLELDMLLLL